MGRLVLHSCGAAGRRRKSASREISFWLRLRRLCVLRVFVVKFWPSEVPGTLKPNEPAAAGDADRLSSAKNVQLSKDTTKVRFHGGFTDVKTDTDLFVTFSPSQELEYIQLSAGKSFAAQAGRYLFYERRRDAGLTSIYPAYAVQQFFASSVLQEIGFGPCFNRPQNLSVRFVRG